MSDKRLLTDEEVWAFERFARSQRAASVGDISRLLADREARKERLTPQAPQFADRVEELEATVEALADACGIAEAASDPEIRDYIRKREEQVRTLREALAKSWEIAGRGLSPSEPEPRERCLDIRVCAGAALEVTKDA